jgi:hypothetical protein
MKLVASRRVVDKLVIGLLGGTLFLCVVIGPHAQADATELALVTTHSTIPLPAPTVAGIDPTSGQSRQRIRVTMTGTHFVKKPGVQTTPRPVRLASTIS